MQTCALNCEYCLPGQIHNCRICGAKDSHRSVHCPKNSVNRQSVYAFSSGTYSTNSPTGKNYVAATMIILVGPEYLVTTEAQGVHAGKTGLPGGLLNPGESPINGAIRETEEEVGIRVHRDQVVGTIDYQRLDGKYVMFCIARLPTKPLVRIDSVEISHYEWADFNGRIPGIPRPGFLAGFNNARNYIRTNYL